MVALVGCVWRPRWARGRWTRGRRPSPDSPRRPGSIAAPRGPGPASPNEAPWGWSSRISTTPSAWWVRLALSASCKALSRPERWENAWKTYRVPRGDRARRWFWSGVGEATQRGHRFRRPATKRKNGLGSMRMASDPGINNPYTHHAIGRAYKASERKAQENSGSPWALPHLFLMQRTGLWITLWITRSGLWITLWVSGCFPAEGIGFIRLGRDIIQKPECETVANSCGLH